MALTDFWELKDHQNLGGIDALNVYHLKRIDPGADAQDVANSFTFSILDLAFRSLQDDGLTRSTVEVQNLGDPTDFFSLDSSAFPGTDTGDRPASFNAASIQFNRTRTDMKNGQKRFLMGNDNDAADGIWDATMIASLEGVRDDILDTWKTAAAPLVDVCGFVILKRWCVVFEQDPCLKYRLPNTDTEVDGFHYAPVNGLVRSRVRSQVSRKRLI